MTGDDLRALSAAATPGPWTISHRCYGKTEMDDESCGLGLEIDQWDEPMRGHISLSADARLTVWLRNHADAIADLIEWANDAPHHDGCNARHNDEQLAHDPPLHPYRCKCGRDALVALDGTP